MWGFKASMRYTLPLINNYINYEKIITVSALIVVTGLAGAAGPAYSQQVPFPLPALQGGGVGPGNGDSHHTPIGGMAVLAVLGGGYAIKKLREKSSKSSK